MSRGRATEAVQEADGESSMPEPETENTVHTTRKRAAKVSDSCVMYFHNVNLVIARQGLDRLRSLYDPQKEAVKDTRAYNMSTIYYIYCIYY